MLQKLVPSPAFAFIRESWPGIKHLKVITVFHPMFTLQLKKYILQFRQITFSIETNMFHNLNDVNNIKHLEVIRVLQHPFFNWDNCILQFGHIHFIIW